MFKTLLIAVVAIVGLVLIYAATRPDTFHIARTVRIQAPPERIYALIDSLRNFNRWNPFEKKDPNLKGTYGGPDAGPGASYAWAGDKIGVGQMTIIENAAPTRVTMKLDFIKPFEAHNTADFTLTPAADASGATDVTWAMHGPSPYVSKLMEVFVSMDKMVGNDFESGLNDLKTLAETS